MTDLLLKLYHRSPYSLRVLAASLRGYYLRRWRYGPETERLVAEALEREAWSPEKWQAWQEERLAWVLHRAATRVPYYREQWAQRRRQGDDRPWEYLENWPLLEKESIRGNALGFVADDCEVRRMFPEHTSGSSGKPLDLFWSPATVRAWYALFEARWRRWYGVSRFDRWGILGGQLIAPVDQRQPPFWVWNAGLNQLYLSSYHLAPELIPHYLEALKRYRVTYLYGYSSSLYALGQGILNQKRRDLQMAVAITNAEPLYDYQRQVIAEAFQCPVRETYGMSEVVAAAGECEAGQLHQWPEVGFIEVFPGEGSGSNGISGELVCTSLLNGDMPFIRYRVGDRASLSKTGDLCPCRRNLPLLASIDGRVDDVLFTADGRRIGRLDPVFKTKLPILEAQIIQETLNLVKVRYVPAKDYSAAAGLSVVERLQARMGPIEVILEPVAEIPRGANGKFRGVVCNLTAEDLARITLP
jgi:phenylacetate-CoA ligase